MATKKKKIKPKVGSLGPQPHWLRLSPSQREKTRQYIREGLEGYVRSDGIKIPGARKIYQGFEASSGYDLRHVERWSAAQLAHARKRIQAINTYTGRPFAVITPRTKKQRKEAQKVTGQDLPYQRKMIYAVQDPKRDKVVFRNNKLAVERNYKHGSKAIEQRFLFKDYSKEPPYGFDGMRKVTEKMLPDMPINYRGEWVYYTLLTVQYGPVGESVPHHRIMEHLAEYHNRYDLNRENSGFQEQVIGFQMIGTYTSVKMRDIATQKNKSARKKLKKLRFSQQQSRCHVLKNGKRCKLRAGHKGPHKFKK